MSGMRLDGTAGETCTSVEDYRDRMKRRRRKAVGRPPNDMNIPVEDEGTPIPRPPHKPPTPPSVTPPPSVLELIGRYMYHYLILIVAMIFLILLVFGWGRGWKL